MARRADGPWFRAGKNCWYASVNGEQVNLRVKGAESRADAVKAWHRLMAGESPRPPAPEATTAAEPVHTPPPARSERRPFTVAELVLAFMADAAGRMSNGCRRNYRIFLDHLSAKCGNLGAVDLTDVEAERTASRPDWSTTYRANYLACISTAFRWATRHRLIPSNPLTDLRKPVRRSRGVSAVVSEDEHKKLLAVADPLMRDLLTVLWATGARPGEITGLTCDMVKRATDGVIPLAEHKNAGKGKPRFLILTGEAWEVASRRATGDGLLFRGSRDGPLTPKAISSRMRRLCDKAGVRAIAYGYRHGFATDALVKGLPDAQVAALLGHSSTTMLHKHYSHLTGQSRVLRDALVKVRGEAPASEKSSPKSPQIDRGLND
jgi:integrase